MSEANRVKASEIVEKNALYWGYCVRLVSGTLFHAAELESLIDLVAEYLDSLEPKEEAQ